ncbi:MAG TPA: hypothetical protein VME67_27140 [Mycobacterium sp.]|nr:hypothetical protein [Mycobacterium sp.]HTX98184.1 hypothetical protein [Mycobacterium sp.]
MSHASDRIVVDVDSHWAEPPELWVSRAPAKFKDRVPKLVDEGARDVWVVDGTVMSGFCFSVIDKTGDKLYAKMTIERFADSDPSASYAEPRLAKMDEMGLSGQVIYPNAIGFGAVDLLAGVKDGELLNLCASIYNEAMADLQRDGKGRLFPQGIIPFWDLDESVRTVEQVKDLGLHGIVMCDSPETCVSTPRRCTPTTGIRCGRRWRVLSCRCHFMSRPARGGCARRPAAGRTSTLRSS